MITESKYHSKLYGKRTRSFEFETLEDLRQLRARFKAVQIYYFKDACVSFLTLPRIRKQTKEKTVNVAGDIIPLFQYLKQRNKIIKLANLHRFTCEVLRGYSNTYKIEWQTKTEIITAKTKINLWREVSQTIETGKNDYAQHTVKTVKLVPHRPQILKTNYSFALIRWYGGNVTTYNDNTTDEHIKAFDLCLFYAMKRTPSNKRFSLRELENMKTLCTGQADNLKFDDGNIRVWLSRCSIEDGEPYNNKATVEKLINGKWKTIDTYEAK